MNSSFYGPPRPEVSRAWVERTPHGFRVLAEAASAVHASEDVQRSALGDLPDATPEALAELSRVTRADVDHFKDGIEPIASAGKLGALLAQFPAELQGHSGQPRTTWSGCSARSGTIRSPWSCATAAWSDRIGETLELLNAFGAAWTQIDEPKFRSRSARTSCRT